MSLVGDSLMEARSNTNLGFIKTALAPRHYNVAPSSDVGGAPSFNKPVDYACTYTVTAPVAYTPPATDAGNILGIVDQNQQSEEVAGDTGMILWLVANGVDAIYHMGFVRPNARSGGVIRVQTPVANCQPGLSPEYNQTLRGLGLQGDWPGASGQPPLAAFSVNESGCPALNFEWRSPVALPRTGDSTIQISPALEKNFSRSRLFAGVFNIDGSAVPIGVTALTGEFSAGAIASTRDIARDTSGTEVTCYDVSALSQQSVTAHDGLKLIPLKDGVTTIVGPDFPEQFSTPQQITSDFVEGEWATFTIPAPANIGSATPPQVADLPIQAFETFISPWDCDMYSGSNSGTFFNNSFISAPGAKYTRIQTNTLDETGVLDIDVTIPWDLTLSANMSTTGGLTIYAKHVFCTVNPNGTVNYNCFSEAKEVIRDKHDEFADDFMALRRQGDSNSARYPTVASFRPRRFRSSFVDTGKYIGTYVQASVHVVNRTGTGGFCNWGFDDIRIDVRARGIDKAGRVGMAHILRYDNVSNGQTLTMRGKALVQCVAEGEVAPFVQSAIATAPVAVDAQTLVLLRLLFRGGFGGRFCRNYRTNNYEDNITMLARTLTPAKLKQILTDSEEGVTTAVAAQAAGIFGTLGGAVGGVADSLFGSAGTFGQAAGTFGHAAGEFGASGSSYISDVTSGYRRGRDHMLSHY
jgi:hypothetical protein